MYIADFNNVRVRKISKNGVITTVAGGGTTGLGDGGNAKNAQPVFSRGITVDKDGNLYIADRDDNRVRKVATNGIITTIAGTGVQGFSGDGVLQQTHSYIKPYGVAVDTMGNIFISDQYNYRIRKITRTASLTQLPEQVPPALAVMVKMPKLLCFTFLRD